MKEAFKITGGKSLNGEVTPQGAKNEALQILCAVLLTPEEVIIKNIPDIIDIRKLISLLQIIGVKVTQLSQGAYSFQADTVAIEKLYSSDYSKAASSIRGSIMLVGPLLARFKKGFIPRPGGDKIGRRRLDTHFDGLKSLGASFEYDNQSKAYNASCETLKGTKIYLDEASVTGTANILMASVLAEGETVIYNAACEPYLQQLSKMLNSMGAKITGIGSNLLTIQGVKSLKGTTHHILPDMIEIGSWIGIAAMTRSKITIKNASWENLGIIPTIFKRLGISIEKTGDDDLLVDMEGKNYEVQSFIDGSILTISDAPWPGFTPDLISIVLVVATQAKGSVLVHQKMFESRLFFVDKLIDMGAKIILCDPHRATVIGHNFEDTLRATNMVSPDIRAGLALLIAALSAKGTSYIHNISQIDRGYESIDKKLQQLGADIERVNI